MVSYRLNIKLNQLAVWGSVLYGLYFPYNKNLVFITGFPKSGTTWVSQLVAGTFGYGFNNKPMLPAFSSEVVHCHRSYKFLSSGYITRNNIIYVVRDPRDVLVSAYYALTNSADRVFDNSELPKKVKDLYVGFNSFDNEDDAKKWFVLKAIDSFPGSPLSWGSHVQEAIDLGAAIVRYEDLKLDPKKALADVVKATNRPINRSLSNQIERVIKNFSFARQKNEHKKLKSQAGFYRTGEVGGYKSEFNLDIVQTIEEAFRSEMEYFGYLPEQ
jgi:hypothetical protein